MRKEYHFRLTQTRKNFGLKNWVMRGRIIRTFHYFGEWGIHFETPDGFTGNILTDGTLQMQFSVDSHNVVDLTGGRYKFEWYAEENPDIGYPIHF